MKLIKTIVILVCLFAILIFANNAYSKEAEIIIVDVEGHNLNDSEEIKTACDLLGISFKTHYVKTNDNSEIWKSVSDLHDKEVLVFTGRVLKYLNKDMFSTFGQPYRKTKILIFGINNDTDIKGLKIWSENNIRSIKHINERNLNASIRVLKNNTITKELGGLEYPIIASRLDQMTGFELMDTARVERIVEIIDEVGNPERPIFIKMDTAKSSLFYTTSWSNSLSTEKNDLLQIMPILLFLKSSFGDRSWHGNNDYANMTIDDPWLREPYGYIRFADLCTEAKKTPFHVTIGFIPYNHKKSNKDALEIFRQCTQNLSLVVHGNNHNLSEFRSIESTQPAVNQSQAIHPDEKNILQALFRMNEFSRTTGLSYDRVMIFPRGIFSKESLGFLKRQNFLMTVNSTRPFNAGQIKNTVDRLRGISLEFEDFPLALRYGLPSKKNEKQTAAMIKSWVQMRLFLDLPVLVYTHQEYFKEGADSFNSTAVMINDIQPKVVWTGLGSIARKLYLQKRVDDRKMEISTYSSNLAIKNNYNVAMKYIIKKQEDYLVPIQSVEVDGLENEYHRDGNDIRIEVMIEPGHEKNIKINYHSDYNVGSFPYSENDLQTTLVRTLSDFRDLYLSKLPLGDRMVKAFYSSGGVKYSVIYLLGLSGVLFMLLVLYINKGKFKKRDK